MPITTSAKKALRQTVRRRARNVAQSKILKETVKKFKKTPTAELLSDVYQKLDKAAKNNIIKPNKAGRLKSRFSKLIKATSQ